MSSAPSYETRIAPGQGVATSRTGARTRFVVTSGFRGELWLYVPDVVDLRDSFVLKDAAATSREDARYWADLKAPEASENPSGQFVLTFDEETNTGTRRSELHDLDDAAYTLIHRPLGDDRIERVLFASRSSWKTFPGGRRRPSSAETSAEISEEEARPPSPTEARIKWLAAVQFHLADSVQFPPPALDALGLGDAVDLHQPAALASDEAFRASDPLTRSGTAWTLPSGNSQGQSAHRPARDAWFLGLPVPAAVREGAWVNGQPESGDEAVVADEPDVGEPGRGRTDSTPSDERWVTVVSAGGGPEFVDIVGVWCLSGDGMCQRATRVDDGNLSLAGHPAPFLLLDVGIPSRLQPRHTAYAYVSFTPPSQARVADLEERLARALEEGGDGFELAMTPFDLDPFAPGSDNVGRLFYEQHHVKWTEDGVWAWYLPDPLRVTAGLAALVEHELEQRRAWTEAVGPAAQHSGFVAATCFDPSKTRDHLVADLAQKTRTETLVPGGATMDGYRPAITRTVLQSGNLVEAWDGFDPYALGLRALPGAGVFTSRAAVTELQQFQYGLFRQRAYLDHRVQVAGGRLAAWVASGAFKEHLRDLVLARVAGEPDETAAEVVARALRAGAEAGPVAGVLLTWLQESGLIDRLATLPKTGRLDTHLGLKDLPASVEEALMERSWFALVWLATEKGLEASVELLGAAGPTILLAKRVGAADAYSARALEAVFGCKALGADPVAADGGRSIGRFRLTQRSLGAAGGPHSLTEWTLSLDGASPERAAQLGGVAGRIGMFVGALDVAITAAGVYESGRQGQLGWGDAVASGQVITELAGLVDGGVEMAVRAGRVSEARALRVAQTGRLFAKASVVLEGAAAGIDLYQAYTNHLDLGLQTVPRRDGWGMAGAALGGAGAVMIAQAAVGGIGALLASPVAAIGVALVATGWAVGWVGQRKLDEEQRKNDPLIKDSWLAVQEVWGDRHRWSERRTLMLDLVRPGWVASGGPPVLAGVLLGSGDDPGLTGSFVERAFAFPVTVRAEPGPGGVPRLAVVVTPAYLPDGAAVAVRASVSYRDEFDLAKAASLAFVVRYGSGDRGRFEYAVEPSVAGGLFDDRAGSVPVGGGLQGLAAYAGPGWAPRAPERPGDVRRDAYAGLHDAVRAAGAALAESEGSVLPVEVPATALVPDARTPGLAAALAAGRFTVTGFAVFDPTRPNDPVVPESRPGPGAVVAVEDIGEPPAGIVYPDDFR